MSIQIYILSRLMNGNSYPYELKKELSAPIPLDQLANLTESKLYYHFDTLSKKGLIEPIEVIKEEHRPDKQIFRITEKGRATLPIKIYQELEKAEKLTDTLIGLINLRFVDRDKVIEILERKLEKFQVKKGYVADLYDELELEGKKKTLIDLYNGYITTHIDTEIHWVEQLIQKMKNNEI